VNRAAWTQKLGPSKKKGFVVYVDEKILEQFKMALAWSGLNRQAYLSVRIHQFCVSVESGVGWHGRKFKKTGKRKQLFLNIDEHLKDRFDVAVDRTSYHKSDIVCEAIYALIQDWKRTAQ